MKTILASIVVLATASACSSVQKGQEQMNDLGRPASSWSTTEVDTPESAYYHAPSETLFVSNVSGSPIEKDAKGWITQFDKNGKVTKAQWASGIDAPKGMRADATNLWVSNIDEVIALDLKTGKVAQRVKVKGAKFLNDVAIGPKGEIFVSDMMTNKIHSIRGNKVTTFMQGDALEGPNGLLVEGNSLLVTTWGAGIGPDFKTQVLGHLHRIDLSTKKKTLVTPKPLGNLDGIEAHPAGGYVVSDWMAGKIFRVNADGTSTVLLEGFQGSADIGIIPDSRSLIVPRMAENQLSAYILP